MASDVARARRGTGTRAGSAPLARLTTETKPALKTTEFWVMLVIVAGILIASWVVGQGDGNGRGNIDAFPAVRAWLYVAIVGVGYMVSRGLAKAGSREPYWADEKDLPGGEGAYEDDGWLQGRRRRSCSILPVAAPGGRATGEAIDAPARARTRGCAASLLQHVVQPQEDVSLLACRRTAASRPWGLVGWEGLASC